VCLSELKNLYLFALVPRPWPESVGRVLMRRIGERPVALVELLYPAASRLPLSVVPPDFRPVTRDDATREPFDNALEEFHFVIEFRKRLYEELKR
jgi:hypothetical protein